MTPALQHLRQFALFCGDCLCLIACWIVWLALGALLVVQVVIALSHEFALPGWMLRSLEARFAASNVHAQFGRATFNPTGGVLLEDVRLSLPAFETPVIRARAVYLDLDPWLLLSGQLEPHRLHATGIKLSVPGMLARSGHDEEIVSDLEFTLAPGDNDFELENLSARVGGIALTAHGAVQLPRTRSTGAVAPLPLLEALASHYPAVCEQLIRVSAQLAVLDSPQLDVSLEPSPARGAIAHATLTARKLALPQFRGLEARELRASARFPLLGALPTACPVNLAVDAMRVGDLVEAHDLVLTLHGDVSPAKFSYAPHAVDLTARSVAARGFTADALAAQLQPIFSTAATTAAAPLLPSQVDAAAIAFLSGEPIAVAGRADLAAQSADLHLAGRASPALLTPISAILRRDIRRFFDFAEPIDLDVAAHFAPGWKFARVAGRVDLRRIDAYRVPIDAARGEIEFDGRHFIARRAFARLGENFARGSFEQDLKTKDYRFLLEGRLRPLDIGGWFHGDWWQNIFSNFEFPDSPPDASVDVTGRWFSAPETAVFVYVDAARPVVRGARFDRARTLLFIRPAFLDGLEVFATRGTSEARGTFERHFDLVARDWRKFVFHFDSSLDLDTGAKLLGPALAAQLTPYTFEHAPQLEVDGDFDGPAAPGAPHQILRLQARGAGAFSFYGFPAHDLTFHATLRDGEVTVENFRAAVASGSLSGRARVWGAATDRRLGFDAAIKGASLHRAITTVTEYAALRQKRPAASSEKLFSGKNDATLDLAISAEGRLEYPFSYEGSGNAALAGELGQVRLLGLLSELINFTALRFTNARTDFKIHGAKVSFPALSITGANSAIEAHGDYLLDRHALDFNARVYPFQESKGILQSVVGAVLTPFSAVFEVKLTGPLDQPKWAFVIGPTNLFRSLSSSPTAPPTSAPAPASPPAPPPTAPLTSTPAAPRTAVEETH